MTRTLTAQLMLFFTLAAVMLSALYIAHAIEVPLGAQGVTEGYESTINLSNYPAATHQAYAGNISELNLSGRSQTKHWQGYYGQVSGTITLDDAQNWTMYDWVSTEPKGEIYATVNTTPDWVTIRCFNYTAGANGAGLGNVSAWETFYNITWNDVDGIDETYLLYNHPAIDVGEYTIYQNTCPSTYTYVSDSPQSEDFSSLLLADSAGRLIFTTIIENKDTANNTDPVGYNDVTHDFQMLVAEDGTSRVGGAGGPRNTATTTYYFYVNLK